MIVLGWYFLYQQLGNSIWPAVALIILVLPLNYWIIIKLRDYQVTQMKYKDKRIKLISEILGGIKVIKLYGWECSFIDQVQDIRWQEEKALRKTVWAKAIVTFIWQTVPFLTIAAAFITYTLIDR